MSLLKELFPFTSFDKSLIHLLCLEVESLESIDTSIVWEFVNEIRSYDPASADKNNSKLH